MMSNRIVFIGATMAGVAMGTCVGLMVAVVGSLKAHREPGPATTRALVAPASGRRRGCDENHDVMLFAARESPGGADARLSCPNQRRREPVSLHVRDGAFLFQLG